MMIGPALIETHRLILRPFKREDQEDLYRLWIDPQVRKYLWDDQIIARETVQEVIESSLSSFVEAGFGFWTINLKGSNRLDGFCGLRSFTDEKSDQPEIEILYGVSPTEWGKGVASEAARAVLQHGFEVVGLPQIFAGADPPNAASFRVIEKLGMTFARQTRINGLEAIYYSITRERFMAL